VGHLKYPIAFTGCSAVARLKSAILHCLLRIAFMTDLFSIISARIDKAKLQSGLPMIA
jgi:hypothetical protein